MLGSVQFYTPKNSLEYQCQSESEPFMIIVNFGIMQYLDEVESEW
jgi:hypothetical protein